MLDRPGRTAPSLVLRVKLVHKGNLVRIVRFLALLVHLVHRVRIARAMTPLSSLPKMEPLCNPRGHSLSASKGLEEAEEAEGEAAVPWAPFTEEEVVVEVRLRVGTLPG